MKVKRIILNGSITEVKFEGCKCAKWLVKNFTSSDIYVSFDSNLVESDSVKIKSMAGQVCIENEYLGGLECFKTESIYIKGTGEVEVQQLCFHM